MKAKLITYNKENITSSETVEIDDNYDGDCYGDTVPFAVGSNQTIAVIDKVWLNQH